MELDRGALCSGGRVERRSVHAGSRCALWGTLGRRKERILDLGCGQGRLAQELSTLGADVIGIDGSEELVRRGRTLYPGQPFRGC